MMVSQTDTDAGDELRASLIATAELLAAGVEAGRLDLEQIAQLNLVLGHHTTIVTDLIRGLRLRIEGLQRAIERKSAPAMARRAFLNSN